MPQGMYLQLSPSHFALQYVRHMLFLLRLIDYTRIIEPTCCLLPQRRLIHCLDRLVNRSQTKASKPTGSHVICALRSTLLPKCMFNTLRYIQTTGGSFQTNKGRRPAAHYQSFPPVQTRKDYLIHVLHVYLHSQSKSHSN